MLYKWLFLDQQPRGLFRALNTFFFFLNKVWIGRSKILATLSAAYSCVQYKILQRKVRFLGYSRSFTGQMMTVPMMVGHLYLADKLPHIVFFTWFKNSAFTFTLFFFLNLKGPIPTRIFSKYNHFGFRCCMRKTTKKSRFFILYTQTLLKLNLPLNM